MLFKIFINYLVDEIESTLTKLADDAKLDHEMDITEGTAVLKKDLDKLEDWISKSCMKFNKDSQKNF